MMELSNGVQDLNHYSGTHKTEVHNCIENKSSESSEAEIVNNMTDVQPIPSSLSTDTGFGSDSTVSTPGPETDSKQIVSDLVSELVEKTTNSVIENENTSASNSVFKDQTFQNSDSEVNELSDVLPKSISDGATEKNVTVEESVEYIPNNSVINSSVSEHTKCTNTSEDKVSQQDACVNEKTETMDSSLSKNGDCSNNETGINHDKESEDENKVIDILGNGFLKKKVILPGKGESSRPTSGDTVSIRVKGVLEDKTPLNEENFTFILNDGDVIMAFDLGVALMEANETCELFTDSRYAYGSLGRQPDIPGDANITYQIQLMDIQPAEEFSSLSPEKRLQMGETKRERGNYLYGRQDYTGAINSYNKATKILDDTDLNASLDEATRDLLAETYVKCYNNMAACQLKVEAFDAAIRSCEKVLAVQANNIKALFRIGKAYGIKNEVDKALGYLRRGIKLDPESKMFHQEVLVLARRKTQQSQSEKEMYRKMLGVTGETAWEAKRRKDKKSGGVMKWVLMAGSVAAVVAGVGLTYFRYS